MDLRGWLRGELDRPVAGQAGRAPWALGLAALLLLLLVAASGVPPALSFDAARLPEQLRGSVLRGVHAWAAGLLLVLVLAHVARAAWTRAYRGPRRATWHLGVLVLAALLAMFWLGTALRGDQQGYEAWRHGREALGLAGLRAPDGEPFAPLLWLHALALPALLAGCVALHVRRVRRLDLAPLDPPAPRVPFAAHARAALRVAGPLALLVVLLGAFAPPELGPAPLPHLEAARAPWPFAWLVPWQDALGTPGIPLGLGVLFGGLAVLPRIDAASPRAARAVLALLLAMMVALGTLASLGPAPVRILGWVS